jgi:organic hydroperoxide reductase OsmC/OhrA
MKQHTYEVQVDWTGNPSFRGDPSRYNPEELLVASLSSCHMLSYLHLCAVNHITVVDYQDAASGVMQENADGSGEFKQVVLRPTVKLLPGDDRAKAQALHDKAHHLCFIARSVNFPLEVLPTIAKEAVSP